MIAVRPHRSDLNGLAGRLGWGDDRLGGEVERNPQHIGVFHIEQTVFIQSVGLPTQGAPNDLLTQQLRTKGAHA